MTAPDAGVGRESDADLDLEVDLENGARITSLRDRCGREWLWCHPDPATAILRRGCRSSRRFVDAGGIEECFPTVSGGPDHGEAWSSRWTGDHTVHQVTTSRGTLTRRISQDSGLTLDHRLDGPPGTAFVWAFHALLRPEPGTRIRTDGQATRVWDSSGQVQEGRWPHMDGTDLSRLGENDGTARFVLLPGATWFELLQAAGSLRLGLTAPGQPSGVGLWRNLAGYSWDDGPPYRSFGVEPMIGDHPDLDRATSPGRIGRSGTVTWTVRLQAGPTGVASSSSHHLSSR